MSTVKPAIKQLKRSPDSDGCTYSALRNPRVSDAAKESAREQLDQMNQYMTERDKSSDRPEGRLK